MNTCQSEASAAEGRPSWFKKLLIFSLLLTRGIGQPVDPQPLNQLNQFFSPPVFLDQPFEIGPSEAVEQLIRESQEREKQDGDYTHAENECHALILDDAFEALQDPDKEPSYNPGSDTLTQSLVYHKKQKFYSSPYTVIWSTPSEIQGKIRITQYIRKCARNLVDYVACRQTLVTRRFDDETAVTAGDGSNYALVKEDNKDRLVRVGYYFGAQDEFHAFDGAQFETDYSPEEIAKKQRQVYTALTQQLAHLNTLDPLLKDRIFHSPSTELGMGRAPIEWDCRKVLLHDAFTALQKTDTAPSYSNGWWSFSHPSVSCDLDQRNTPPYRIVFTRSADDVITIRQSITHQVGQFIQNHWCRKVLLEWRRKEVNHAHTATVGYQPPHSLIKTGYTSNKYGKLSSLILEADFSRQEIAKMQRQSYAERAQNLQCIASLDPFLNEGKQH